MIFYVPVFSRFGCLCTVKHRTRLKGQTELATRCHNPDDKALRGEASTGPPESVHLKTG